MSDNGMKDLICGGIGHPAMDKLMETGDPRGPIGRVAFSLWICQQCGVMALHLETPGDIYWYKSTVIDRKSPRGMAHTASCGYCPANVECSCTNPDGPHMCPRCDAAAEESKVTGKFPIGDPGEQADEARQQKAYEARVDAYDRMAADDEEATVRQQEEADDRQAEEDDDDDDRW